MTSEKDLAFAADLRRLEAELAARRPADQSNPAEIHGPFDPRLVQLLRAGSGRPPRR